MPSYPVERTLLTSGLLEAAHTSRCEGHRRVETAWLDVTYRTLPKQVVWEAYKKVKANRGAAGVDRVS